MLKNRLIFLNTFYDLSYMINHAMYFGLNRAGVFNQSEIGNEHALNFQNKMKNKFQKIQK